MPVCRHLLVAVVPSPLRSTHLTFHRGPGGLFCLHVPASSGAAFWTAKSAWRAILWRGLITGVTPSLPGSPPGGGECLRWEVSSLCVSDLSGRGLRSVGIARARLCQCPEHCRVCGDPSRGGWHVCGLWLILAAGRGLGERRSCWGTAQEEIGRLSPPGVRETGSAAGSVSGAAALYFKPGGPSSPLLLWSAEAPMAGWPSCGPSTFVRTLSV